MILEQPPLHFEKCSVEILTASGEEKIFGGIEIQGGDFSSRDQLLSFGRSLAQVAVREGLLNDPLVWRNDRIAIYLHQGEARVNISQFHTSRILKLDPFLIAKGFGDALKQRGIN